MKKTNLIRIVNKSKDGITLRINGKVTKYSWDTFNRDFKIVDNIWAELTPEAKERYEEIDDRVNRLTVLLMTPRNSDPKEEVTRMSLIGFLSTGLCKDLGCSLADLKELVSKRISATRRTFSRPKYTETTTGYRTDNKVAKVTMSDLPGMDKLKEKFGIK